MITPVNKAPRKFMAHYSDILAGREKLDTKRQIADFWLFAVEQGKPHIEMREYIANCVIVATNRPGLDSPVPVGDPLYEAYDCWQYCSHLSSWVPRPEDTRYWKNQEEFYDQAWDDYLGYWVNELQEEFKK